MIRDIELIKVMELINEIKLIIENVFQKIAMENCERIITNEREVVDKEWENWKRSINLRWFDRIF